MKRKQAMKLPYGNTTVSAERSKAEIEKLLKENEIQDIAWITVQGKTTLSFRYYVEVKGVQKGIVFQFSPPQIFVTKRTYNPKINRYEKLTFLNEPVSYRLLWWYLKAKLEAVKFGLESLEKEFMSQILLSLPQGDTTMGEVVKKAIETGRLEQIALPEQVEERKIVESKEVKEYAD